jgi:hypothetical protein
MKNPCARRNDVFAEPVGSETILYDKLNHKAHSLNRTVALIWEQADGQKSIGDLAGILHDELAMPVDVNVVLLALEELNRAGLLQPVEVEMSAQMPSRREMARKLALSGVSAALIPLVASVLAPTPAMASSTITPAQAALDFTIVTAEAALNPNFRNSGTAQSDLRQAGVALGNRQYTQEIADLDGVIQILGLPPLP